MTMTNRNLLWTFILVLSTAGTAHAQTQNGVTVSPATATISPGQTKQYTATASFSNGSSRQLHAAKHASAGGFHGCALLANGAVNCWGENIYGQLGNGGSVSTSIPTTTSGISGALHVATGYQHSCAILADTTVKCWGSNQYGKLGDGTGAGSLTPVVVLGLSDVVSVAPGYFHTCAVKSDGTVWCWGWNVSGQLGLGNNTGPELWGGQAAALSPRQVIGIDNAISVAVGLEFSCAALADGTASCWGQNSYGNLGIGNADGPELCFFEPCSTTPVPVVGLDMVSTITAGQNHVCALVAGGDVKCWGYGAFGQLGIGSSPDVSATPAPVLGLSTLVQNVSAGHWHTCAAMADGTAQCWGSNLAGALGVGTAPEPCAGSTCSSTPLTVASPGPYAHVDSGYFVSCGRLTATAGGLTHCWGQGTDGQLGDGTIVNAPTPVEVLGIGALWTTASSAVATIDTTGLATAVAGGTTNVKVTTAVAGTATATLTVAQKYTLTVVKTGLGTGTVTSSPVGISCGADCTEDYASGTTVTLTATAAVGSSFVGWSGPCTGTKKCIVSMTAAKTAFANFKKRK